MSFHILWHLPLLEGLRHSQDRIQPPRRLGVDWERAGSVVDILGNQGWITTADDNELPVGNVVGNILSKGHDVAE